MTANKALLAADGPTLFEAAEKAERDLYYEAAVAGAIPILRPLRESLAGDRVTRVLGIVNGTTNFILDKMDTSGAGFAEALEEAQELGYAEADPTADVEGFDAAAKAAILASLAFHSRVTAADVHREGISEVTAADVAVGARDGLASSSCSRSPSCAERRRRGGRGPGPPRDDPAVPPAGLGPRGVQRGLRRVRGRRPADVLRPRRRRLADRVRRARRPGHRRPQPARGHPRRRASRRTPTAPVLPMGETLTRYHVAIDVDDRAGVLAAVATAFADHGVSIQTVSRRAAAPTPSSSSSPTPRPTPSSRATVEQLRGMDIVREVTSVMRVEGDAE